MYSKFFDFKTANGFLIRKFWSLFLKIGLLTNQIEFVSADYRSFRDIMIKKKSILFFEKETFFSLKKD